MAMDKSAKTNRPHYHAWFLADGDRALFKRARGFTTRQAARQYAKRRELEAARFTIRECWHWHCRPKLD